MQRDLSVFVRDNELHRNNKRRVPWKERVDLIHKEFPSTTNVDWLDNFDEADIARIIRDILKFDQVENGRSGPRPGLEYEKGMQSWRDLIGEEYSDLPFHQSFAILARNNSLTAIARKTNISRSRVHRLLRNEERPTVGDMRQVAEAYGKRPPYFFEYRCEYILAAVALRLDKEPELAAVLYRKLVNV